MNWHFARALVTVVAVVSIGGAADAQSPRGARGGGGARSSAQPAAPRPQPAPPTSRGHAPQSRPVFTPTVPPFPSIATLSGPLSQGLLPPFSGPQRDLFRVGSHSRRGSFSPGFAYGGYYGLDTTTAPAATPVAPPATGFLRLSVTPGSAQVFVDGYYAGTADDIENRRGLTLAEGPHRIELRANGYATQTFDVDIPPHDVIRYRGALDLERSATTPVKPGPATMYVIPGCYMGNVPPRPERVGPGCDVKHVRVIPPQQTSASADLGRR